MSDVSVSISSPAVPAPNTPAPNTPAAQPASVVASPIPTASPIDDLSIPPKPAPSIREGAREIGEAMAADISRLRPSAVLAETGLGHISTEAHTALLTLLTKLRTGEQVIVTSAEDLIGKRLATQLPNVSLFTAHPWLLGATHAIVGVVGAAIAALLHL